VERVQDKLAHLPASSPASPVSLMGLASVASESPGEAALGGGGDAETRESASSSAVAHGANVLFSLPGRR